MLDSCFLSRRDPLNARQTSEFVDPQSVQNCSELLPSGIDLTGFFATSATAWVAIAGQYGVTIYIVNYRQSYDLFSLY
jgi:hypothetical protein